MPAQDESSELVIAALRAVAPPTVLVGARAVDPNDEASLHDDERWWVRAAAPRRRSEFASGRVLLRELTGTTGAIPVAANRAPVLPAGFRGSLAHDERLVVAAVSADPDVASIGIDVEPMGPLDAADAAIIVRPDESGLDARMVFSIKEATYKAWSSLGGRMLEHHDVKAIVSPPWFEVVVEPEGRTYCGSIGDAAGRWIALVVDGGPPLRPAQEEFSPGG